MKTQIEYCTYCDKEITGEVFDLNDEPSCESCYMEAIDRAEYNYESMKENEATGN